MPKEVVRGDHGGFDLVVKWTNDLHAQVGVVTDAGESLVERLYGRPESLENIGRMLLRLVRENELFQPVDFKDSDSEAAFCRRLGRCAVDSVQASEKSPGDVNGYSGVWVDPTRSGWNQMVRAARRARNSVFGADE